jgi:hypothetical protein
MTDSICFNLDDLSPHLKRIMQLAAIEASAKRNDRGDRICDEHVLIAMCQEGTGAGADLIKACGLSVADIRAGVLVPKTAGQ